MMDTVIRDVDIRTEKHISESKEDLFWNGKKVSQMYFVTDGDGSGGGGGSSYVGDGSPENPFSIEQYRALINRLPNPDFIIIPIGEFTAESFAEVTSHSTAVDHRAEDVVLAANNGSTLFKIVDIPILQVKEDREEAIIDMMYNYDEGLDAYDVSNQDQTYYDTTKADCRGSGYGTRGYSPQESYHNESSPEESRSEPRGSPESVVALSPEPQAQIPISVQRQRVAPSSPAARSGSRRVLLSGSRAKVSSPPPKPRGRLETTYANQNIGNVVRAEEERRRLQPTIDPQRAQENAAPKVARPKGKMEKIYENQNGGSILDKFSARRGGIKLIGLTNR